MCASHGRLFVYLYFVLFIEPETNNGWVKSVDKERDLGMLTSKDLKFSTMCIGKK